MTTDRANLKSAAYLSNKWGPPLEELRNPESKTMEAETPTDMAFWDLVNRRLDHVKAYNSESHYRKYVQLARRWVSEWGALPCGQIDQNMIEQFILKRAKISAYTANQEIRYLRAVFNWGKKRKFIAHDPTDGIDFLPVDRKVKYLPPPEDIDKVIAVADPDTQDYLWTIRDTMARIGEVNRLRWDDVDFEGQSVTLYTRKKKGGHLTPRKVPLTERLHRILTRRFQVRDKNIPWVFWHRYWSRKKNEWVVGPYQDRKKLMATLCKKAGVRYFRYHALRHSGASVMDGHNVPMGAIQRILGHENRSTTEIYLHSLGQSEREAVAIFEQATQKSHPNSHPVKKKRLRLVS